MPLSIAHVTFDCEDAGRTASFWARLLDEPADDGASEFFATIGLTRGRSPALMFIKVPEPKAAKNRLHLDLHSEDKDKEVQRAVELGATRLGDYEEYGTRWTTLRDPEGNEFDIGAGM
jgi:Glyoxalase-like domain